MKTTQTLLSTFVAVLALAFITQTSFAQIVPFHASGSDAVYSPVDTQITTGAGKATHMGKVVVSGVVFPIPTANPLVFDWFALGYEITAANGDKIILGGSGSVEFIPIAGGLFTAVWTADFDVLSGTGRFANVGPGDAPLTVSAVNDPLSLPPGPGDIWTYSWVVDGTIDLGNN